MCKVGGVLSSLDLSSVGLTDRGARKLFEAIMTGEYVALTTLKLAGNELKDAKANGMIEMLRVEGRVIEVPVSYYGRKGGESKHSSSLAGSAVTAIKMLDLIFRKRFNLS